MKKLNNKGFTLIELLAIIVILAIIMVVTIPTVLSSIKNAREESFKNAVASIEKYAQDNYELCIVGDTSITGGFDTAIFQYNNGVCTFTADANTKVITKAGYSTADIDSISLSLSNGDVVVDCAVPKTNGKFNGVPSVGSSCPGE